MTPPPPPLSLVVGGWGPGAAVVFAVEMLCNSGVWRLWMGLAWRSQAAACCGSVSTVDQRQTQAGDSCVPFGTNPPAFLVWRQAVQVLADQLTFGVCIC